MPAKSARKVTSVKPKSPVKAPTKSRGDGSWTLLNGWIIDATYEQHMAVRSGLGRKPGQRSFDLQVGWGQPQWTPEKHILFTMQIRGVIVDSQEGIPVSVTEMTYMSELTPPQNIGDSIKSDDVFHMAQSVWPNVRDGLNALYLLGVHQPPVPADLKEVMRAQQTQLPQTA